MKRVAQKLRTQASALKSIANSDQLKGEYAQSLEDKARGLSRRLDLAEDRYREVKGHLNGWADDLETAQSKADRALDKAQEAQRTLDSKQSQKDHPKGDGADAAEDDPQSKRAEGDLEEARRDLRSAVDYYGERAAHYAGKIRSSIDDDMEDSVWNDIKGWVRDADWLKTVADWLSKISTVLTIVALFIPVVGQIAMIVAGAIMLIHVIMAVTGNGSWTDVVMDIGAFKLGRIGVKAGKAIRGLQKSSRNTSGNIARAEAKRSAGRASSGLRRSGGKAGRLHRISDFQKGRAAARKVQAEELPTLKKSEELGSFGDHKMAQQIKDIRRLRDQHPQSGELQDNAVEAARQYRTHKGAWGASLALDIGDKGASNLSNEYGNFKGNTQAPIGSQW